MTDKRNKPSQALKLAIFGAGSTGCYLGGLLSLAGCRVSLICRERIRDEIIAAGGITLSDYEGQHLQVMPENLITHVGDEQFDLVFVTLKCHQLESAAQDLARLAAQGAVLMFMQNGIGSLDRLALELPADNILQGITPFNVLSKGNAHFHRGTEGTLMFQKHPLSETIALALKAIHFEAELHTDMRAAIYGKLLMNLNNALNALADMPIKAELENRKLRQVLAQAMKEWLAVCQAQSVQPLQYAAVKPTLIPWILSLPNPIFRLFASKMLAIDPEARSSMWEDIQQGRKTEIDYINGAVVDLGKLHGIETPVNSAITTLIKKKEEAQAVGLEELLALI